jgi:capsular polysaccharide export protein
MDRRGIYYDATRPSDLEHLLQTMDFPLAFRARARALRSRIVAAGITKYAAGGAAWIRPEGAARVILVPGQVESDASLRLSAPAIRTNMELLQAVRHANPGSYVIYKPHPDVAAGLRARGSQECRASSWCDAVITDVAMGALLKAVDEVHVMTSLSGFEALLREKIVVCYGLPFYAGWGLTRDLLSADRRTRRLSLDELVGATLLTYPTYLDRTRRSLRTAEQTLDELQAWAAGAAANIDIWKRLWRAALRLSAGST